MSDLADAWLEARLSEVPVDFRTWLLQRDGEAPRSEGDLPERRSRELEARGLAALERALDAPGRVRESAFHLLAADAYVTWAAEALVELPDPLPALRALLSRVSAREK